MKQFIVILGVFSLTLKSMQQIKKNIPKAQKMPPIIFNTSRKLPLQKNYSTENIKKKIAHKGASHQTQKIRLPQKIKFYSTHTPLDNKNISEKNLFADIPPQWKNLILDNFYALKKKYGMEHIKKLLNTYSDVKQYTDAYFTKFEEEFIQESQRRLDKFKLAIAESIEDKKIRDNCLAYLTKMHLYHTKEIIKNIHEVWGAVKKARATTTIEKKTIDQVPIKKIVKMSVEPKKRIEPITVPQKNEPSWISKVLSKLKDFFSSVSKTSKKTEMENSDTHE